MATPQELVVVVKKYAVTAPGWDQLAGIPDPTLEALVKEASTPDAAIHRVADYLTAVKLRQQMRKKS